LSWDFNKMLMDNKKTWRTWFATFYLVASVCLSAQGLAENQASGSKFLRFVETGERVGHVDTALTTYRLANGVEVALVGALHIGDGAYYKELNERFLHYDSVLYEMIKEKHVRPEAVSGSGHPISQIQLAMKSMLGLEFQLEGVDYTAKNFVHADMDPRTFSRLQGEKGENFFTLFLQSILQERRMQLTGSVRPLSAFDLLMAFSQNDSAHALKWLFAQQLDQIESMLSGIDQGMDGKGSVIVSARNQVALKVMWEQIRAKKRRVAVFYGAGHMPDLEAQLLAKGFRKVRHEWLTAWDLRP